MIDNADSRDLTPIATDAELTAVRPESEVQRLRSEVTRLRLERDIQVLKADLAQLRARAFRALWTGFIGTDVVVWFAARLDWMCSVAAVIILGVAFLAYVLDLRSKIRDAQAVLERKQSELWPQR